MDLDRAHPATLAATATALPVMLTHARAIFTLGQVANPILRSHVVTGLWCRGNCAEDRIQVDARSTRQPTRLIQQERKFKTPIPEPARTFFFAVRSANNILGPAAYPPIVICQPPPKLGQQLGLIDNHVKLRLLERFQGSHLVCGDWEK